MSAFRGLVEALVLAALLLPAPASGAGLRAKTLSPAIAREKRPEVAQLLLDIDQSVRKEGADAEIVFATLLTYDQQLEASLWKEMGTMKNTVDRLSAMRATYTKEINASRAELHHLGQAAQGSEAMASRYRAGTSQANIKFDSLLRSVNDLSSLLQGAAITPAGDLVVQAGAPNSHNEQSKAYDRIRRLLASNRAIQPQFPDVFDAFLSVAAVGTHHGKPEVPAQIRMNSALLSRTIKAVEMVKSRLNSQRSQALVQLQSWQRKLSVRATSAEASADEQQGVQAEKEEKVEELSFSSTFTQAVLGIDRGFYEVVQASMQKKADVVEAVRHARQSQIKTLTDLIDLLDGRYSVDDQGAKDEQAGNLTSSFSFVQVKQRSKANRHQISNLQFEIETALHNKADTHGILLRVKAMLDESALDTGSLQDVATDMESVLQTVDNEQSRADDAKQKCESQNLHNLQEDHGLRANLALMNSVRNNTKRAMKAARANLKGIRAKTQALDHLAKDFTHTVGQAMTKLEGQSKDRGMMMVAVKMASEMTSGRSQKDTAVYSATQRSAATALLQQMLQDLEKQDAGERAYREATTAFRGNFLSYVREYLQLLKERRAHYESSLSALELYSTEVANDANVQSDSVATGTELKKESTDLCDSILKFYQSHNRRRAELSNALRMVLPKVPDVLSLGDETPQHGNAWQDIQ
jgi:hypothetical protein